MITETVHKPSERLFEPFFDPIDAAVLIPAGTPLNRITEHLDGSQLRFPLGLDGNASLSEHLKASDHAPASGRFGAFCDNIMGMNWMLPNGRRVRIGERVVKSTTGYDWLRFLIHTDGRFGHPTDHVIRLRPECDRWISASFQRTGDDLTEVTKCLLHSGWMHWWDSVDLLAKASGCECRVTINCPTQEADLFEEELQRVADRSRSQLTLAHGSGPPLDGLPDLSIKTTNEHAQRIATHLVSRGMDVVLLTYPSVIHAYTPDPGSIPPSVAPFESELADEGGHWMSRHHPRSASIPVEGPWLESLSRYLNL